MALGRSSPRGKKRPCFGGNPGAPKKAQERMGNFPGKKLKKNPPWGKKKPIPIKENKIKGNT